eukprot:SAG31_NODE_34966_length_327_cov_1.122807_1_plen_22_part_10
MTVAVSPRVENFRAVDDEMEVT